ncbi:transglutaminase family protein [Ramlibacter sp. WS9]|uniref:transglutaminase-like domain-containing protein n=1 Tax=Ramlibacter sp. WS9 TaxID=1882741 RepID=UPI001143D6B5|nr:transglutaminase family protein [Ramlibacter sp. WS9]ROZ78862.1 transglutaminase family protein [Ramlibacter sp. WS9]
MVLLASQFDAPRPQPAEHVSDRPQDWLGNTPLLDLDDPKLRLKARSLIQLCRNDRDKALAIYRFVKNLPYTKRIKLHYPTARDVLHDRGGDGDDKVTLLIALMRSAGIPARVRYMEMRGEMLRGLTPGTTPAARPLAEIWLGRWVRTDTFIFDAAYVAAARERLKANGWECGWGFHMDAQQLWNGKDDAFLGGLPIEQDPMLTRVLCVVSDPLELVSAALRRNGLRYRRSLRALQWNILAPTMIRAIRELRAGRF